MRAVPRLQEVRGAGIVASFAAYGLIVWGLAALLAGLALRGRTRLIAGAAALTLAGLHTAWIAPYYFADEPALAGDRVTILSVNILGGAADPDRLVAAAAGADVVVFLEYDAGTESALAQRDWAQNFPYHVGGVAGGADGTVVFARRPLRELAQLPTRFGSYLVEVDPGQAGAFGLLAAHPANPPLGRIRWLRDAQVLTDAARAYAGPRLVVIGDLNSTPDHVTILRMRATAGLRDAFDEAGAGWPRSYPANRRLVVPLLGLDQALLRGPVTAASAETVRAPGSDHLGIRVELVLS